MKKGIIVLIIALLLAPSVYAEDYKNVEVTKLITSTTSANGQPLSYLDTNNAEVTALLVRFAPGNATGWHKHPVPVYAYVLEGILNVELKDGKQYLFRKGEAILEVMNTLHNGYNSGNVPTTLVVFYTGAVGTPNVIKEAPVALPPR
ncbi:MAG: cupin domain-containing protein [Chlorobium sp.]